MLISDCGVGCEGILYAGEVSAVVVVIEPAGRGMSVSAFVMKLGVGVLELGEASVVVDSSKVTRGWQVWECFVSNCDISIVYAS